MSLPLEIPVAILAGGLKATRLRPVTEKVPKSLVPVAGRTCFSPINSEMLHSRGIRRAVLCIGHLGEMIQRDFGDAAFGVELDYSFDGEKLLGTGGAIKRALRRSWAKNSLRALRRFVFAHLSMRRSRNFFIAVASPV